MDPCPQNPPVPLHPWAGPEEPVSLHPRYLADTELLHLLTQPFPGFPLPLPAASRKPIMSPHSPRAKGMRAWKQFHLARPAQ